MKRLQRRAIILSLVESLLQRDSWCGETHIQKATFFLQKLLQVPLGFDFILYKHGPFSFDLSDELMAMRADHLVQLKSRPPYGPSIVPGENAGRLKDLFPKTIKRYKERVEFVAKELGSFGVAELERIATALYVSLSDSTRGDDVINERAAWITKVKPHISLVEAHRSLESRWEIANRALKFVQTT
jgi:hypothetical protein